MSNYLLTKREYIATKLLSALLENPARYEYVSKLVKEGMTNEQATDKNINKAIIMTDRLLEKLNET